MIASNSGQSGTGAVITRLDVSRNGVYGAPDGVDGYSPVYVNVPTGSIHMGADDDEIKMLVFITEETRQPWVNYIQSVANDVTVDWGDGTTPSTDSRTGTSRTTCAGVSHTYVSYGLKVITLTKHSGTLSLLESNGFLSFAGAYSTTNGNAYPNNGKYRNSLIQVHIGYNCTVSSLSSCLSLQDIKRWSPILTDGIGFAQNNLLRAELIDGDIYCPSFTSNSRIETVTIPSSITTIPVNCFRTCSNLRYVDFTAIELENGALPITFGTNVFTSTSASLVLMFATAEIAAVAKETTNLTEYSSKIHSLDEEE